ncbi:hypothetical protein JTY60_01900 [symbiont of Argiope bruennichi]|uniref:hypothetical protein n=1 Tax=symbiont of Argiope bruennichi TaxID=2810479 RepID=UPI003DA33B3C
MLKFCCLSGLKENDKRIFFIETTTEIVIFNCGIKIQPENNIGLKIESFDINYLANNSKKVKGLFISNGEFRNCGGINTVVETLKCPVYCSSFTKTILDKYNLVSKNFNNFIILENQKSFKFATFSVVSFIFCSIFPENYQFMLIFNNNINVLILCDIFINFLESKFYNTDTVNTLFFLSNLKNEKTILLINTDNIDKKYYANQLISIKGFAENIIKNAKGRIIFSLYNSDFYRFSEIIDLVLKYKKKLYIHGKNFFEVFKYAASSNIIDSKNVILGNFKNLQNDSNAVIVLTDDNEEIFLKIEKILTENDNFLKFLPSDTFVSLTKPVPGFEIMATNVINCLYSLEINCQFIPADLVFTAPLYYDLINLLSVIKPIYVLSISGNFQNQKFLEQILKEHFANKIKTFFWVNGDILQFNANKSLLTKTSRLNISLSYLTLSSSETSNVEKILEIRKQLLYDGLITVNLLIDSEINLKSMNLILFGVVSEKDEAEQKKQLFSIIKNILNNWNELLKENKVKNNFKDLSIGIKKQISNKINNYFVKKFNKRPLSVIFLYDHLKVKKDNINN